MTVSALRPLAFLLILWWSGAAQAVTTVSPNGVTVSSSGPSTVFLTFQGLDPTETSAQAFWCGAVTAGVGGGSVTAANPCVTGTMYGVLPARNDQSRISGSGAQRNFTDLMTIPGAVARRAYQDAQAGKSSEFYYVRQFTGGAGGDRFVVVTCRLAGGGGAGNPLALLDVRLAFQVPGGEAPIFTLARGAAVPRLGATIFYSGSGMLRGRWEVAFPADPVPSNQDLLTEATLPLEQRGQQRRYTLVERFDRFLSPEGRLFLPGPDPGSLPVQADGSYRVLLRIEGNDGVAGFPMPMLRYHVGAGQSVSSLRRSVEAVPAGGVTQALPEDGATIGASRPLQVSWLEVPDAANYRVEFASEKETVFSAIVEPGTTQYEAPPFLRERPEKTLRWRVLLLGRGGKVTGSSGFRTLRFD